ncbi:hypothetical protein [Streptomyces sp. NPDC001717]|uniref:hypothetical protein n=1 Tax=Streptomyces sp. NPDC001717 TaxID=3364604 RepID=UPI0036C00AF3
MSREGGSSNCHRTELVPAGELRAGFAAGLAETLVEDAAMHRLWYDLRSQALFEESFRADVLEIAGTLQGMIWRIVTRYAELSGTKVAPSPAATYAMLDGLFQQQLLHHLAGDEYARTRLAQDAGSLLGLAVPGGG